MDELLKSPLLERPLWDALLERRHVLLLKQRVRRSFQLQHLPLFPFRQQEHAEEGVAQVVLFDHHLQLPPPAEQLFVLAATGVVVDTVSLLNSDRWPVKTVHRHPHP